MPTPEGPTLRLTATRRFVRIRRLVSGFKYRYPTCCVIRFAIARRTSPQAWRRGVIPVPGRPDETCVPCGIFHKAEGCLECGRRRALPDLFGLCRFCVHEIDVAVERILERV